MTVGIIGGNAANVSVVTVTWAPSEVATITAPAQTVTVPGVKTGDAVFVTPPGQTAGVTIGSAYVSAADTVSVQFVNPTAGNVTPASGVHIFTVIRKDAAISKVQL